MARAFSAFANRGSVSDPIFVTKIVDRDGITIYEAEVRREVVMSEETAWMITDILREALNRGTGRFANIPTRYNVASKTGTTDQMQDLWTVGYSTEYVFSLWIGNDVKAGPLMWEGHRKLHDVFGSLVRGTIKNPTPFHPRPQGVVPVEVCSKSGLLPGPHCTVVTEFFRRRHEPSEQCNIHVVVRVCSIHGHLAGEFCPEDTVEERVFLNRPEFLITDERWSRGPGRKPADASLMPPTEECTVHGPTYTLTPSPVETGVRLTWNNNRLENDQGYNLYRRSFDSDRWVMVNQDLIPISSREFTDNFLVPRGLAVEYRLMVVNQEGQERRVHPETTFVRPLNAELTATLNQDQTVVLSWNRITAEGFTIRYNLWRNGERIPGGQNLELNGNGPVSWVDESPILGTNQYQVSVVYRAGNSGNKTYESIPSTLRPEATITNQGGQGEGDDDDGNSSLPFWWPTLRLISLI
jgi:membrane carboxypeptidase/penicillin-binding protein PbpC